MDEWMAYRPVAPKQISRASRRTTDSELARESAAR